MKLSPYELIGRFAKWDDYKGVITKCEWDDTREDYAFTIMAGKDYVIAPPRPYVKYLGEFLTR